MVFVLIDSRPVTVCEACDFIREFEVSDHAVRLGTNWVCPMPLEMVLRRVIRPMVFVLQKGVDPEFLGERSADRTSPEEMVLVGLALRKILELLALVSRQHPTFATYSDIWRKMVEHGNYFPFGLQSIRMFATIKWMMDRFSFEGAGARPGQELLELFNRFGAVITDPRIPFGSPPTD
ncbi:hypothetical protein C8J57DRAFT_1240293 [Mycena rebaudengoi]|nr:hypothetical protein C8J57DRAFT_1240293 [Mycena rebaudengoi]